MATRKKDLMLRLVRVRTYVVVLLSIFLKAHSAVVSHDYLKTGFSATQMAFADSNGIFLKSIGDTFYLAFFNPDPHDRVHFYLCVIHNQSGKTVWTANRDTPISSSDHFVFSTDGNAALIIGTRKKVWFTNTTRRGGLKMQLQESGNLAILDGVNHTVWQSFDYPTDTLLSGQKFKPGMKLVSSTSTFNTSSGSYFLSMASGNLLLYLAYSPPQVYWGMSQDRRGVLLSSKTTPSYATLDGNGLKLIGDDSTEIFAILFSNASPSTILTRAWLSDDGNLYGYIFAAGAWSQQFVAVQDDCSHPLACGSYGFCSGSGQCSCQGLTPLNKTNLAQGCHGPSDSYCKSSSKSASVDFQKIGPGMDYFSNQFSSHVQASGVDDCKQRCLLDCSCLSFFFYNESGNCFILSQLATIHITGNQNHFAYVKTSGLTQVGSQSVNRESHGPPRFAIPVIIGGTAFVIISMITGFAFWFYYVRRKKINLSNEPVDDDDFLETIPGLPTRFTYRSLQIATSDFSEKLGAGGFGSVYEGVLPDKTRVAVKQLEGVGQGKKEFRAEVAIIGSVHHFHLVQLHGFCAEGTHRLLVYEFMANGSLDRCLFVDGEQHHVLDWNTRYNIALGTARGLAYLHDDCREKIIHCDIKPENILLDGNYEAKVSDFGLAKLLSKEQSQVFTTLRGTRGYLAPEWLLNLAISEKSDVYSFGMVLLEIISGRKNFDLSEPSEKWYFPAYAFQQAEHGNLEELVDIKIKGDAPAEQVIRAVHVALWCIQEETYVRPSMAKVVQMLEANIIVPEPPLSSQLAVRLHARMVATVNFEEQFSSAPDFNSQDRPSASYLSEPR